MSPCIREKMESDHTANGYSEKSSVDRKMELGICTIRYFLFPCGTEHVNQLAFST